ncbi:MAG TPA: WbqC family protein [Puia sp.]|nr:WbqC family protein [Puia sp.]
MNLIIESQYFAPIIFYKISYNFSNIVLEQCESYQKMSFRNRCQIVGAQGVVDLSIPLVGGRAQKGLMRDVRIAPDRNWQVQHWRTILSCYSRSPWFDYYRDSLETLYQKPVDLLMDWNQQCLEWSLGVLGVHPVMGRTEEYNAGYTAGEVADWRGRLMPRDREKWGASGAQPASSGAQSSLSGAQSSLSGAGMEEWPAAPRYRQVFEERIGFTPHLSILDLLFCEGKAAIRYIRSSGDGRPPSGVAV